MHLGFLGVLAYSFFTSTGALAAGTETQTTAYERCRSLMMRLADYFSDMDDSDRHELFSLAKADTKLAGRLEVILKQASVLEMPAPLFKSVVDKLNLTPVWLTNLDSARELVQEKLHLPEDQAEFFAKVLYESKDHPKPFTVEGLRGRLTDRAQTDIFKAIDESASEPPVASSDPKPESARAPAVSETNGVKQLARRALNPREYANFLLDVAKAKSSVRKIALKELELLSQQTETPNSKKVGDGVWEISPKGHSIQLRILYGVLDNKTYIISAKVNPKSGGGGKNARQQEWIRDAEAKWRAYTRVSRQ